MGNYERVPDKELPKNNPWDKVKDQLFIDKNGNANFDNTNLFSTSSGVVTTETLKGGIIS